MDARALFTQHEIERLSDALRAGLAWRPPLWRLGGVVELIGGGAGNLRVE